MGKVHRPCTGDPYGVKIWSGLHGDMQRLAEMTSPLPYGRGNRAREHALAWYAIWGLGLITDQAVVISETN